MGTRRAWFFVLAFAAILARPALAKCALLYLWLRVPGEAVDPAGCPEAPCEVFVAVEYGDRFQAIGFLDPSGSEWWIPLEPED